jgi:hypothetical protein
MDKRAQWALSGEEDEVVYSTSFTPGLGAIVMGSLSPGVNAALRQLIPSTVYPAAEGCRTTRRHSGWRSTRAIN